MDEERKLKARLTTLLEKERTAGLTREEAEELASIRRRLRELERDQGIGW